MFDICVDLTTLELVVEFVIVCATVYATLITNTTITNGAITTTKRTVIINVIKTVYDSSYW